jgi:hypothetical protein
MDYSNHMPGFTKLFSGLVHSTVWREEMHVKVVWITMLALADRNGHVLASLPGLADASRVSLEQCQDALARLSSPDVHSRTKLNDGRRIEEVDGGWRLLNYLKYRNMRDDENRRQQIREAVGRYRAKQSDVIDVSHGKPKQKQKQKQSTETDSGDASRPGSKRPRKLPVESASAVKEACEDWTEILGGTAPGSRIAGAWPGLLKLAPWSEVRPVWRWYLAEGKRSGKAEFCNPQDFASRLDYWRDRSQGLAVAPRGRQPIESQVDAYDRVFEQMQEEAARG